jgi:hypothetical protein
LRTGDDVHTPSDRYATRGILGSVHAVVREVHPWLGSPRPLV